MVADCVSIGKVSGKNVRLPDALSEGAALLRRLVACGAMKQIEEGVQVQRQGGYAGVDAIVYLVLYFTSLPDGGLRGLWKLCSGLCDRVGALAGRSALMSSSARSRMLTTVRLDEVRAFSRRLLIEMSGVVDVLRKPAVQCTDGLGRPFHLFAFDPVRLAIRRRGLPEDLDLPDAVRRTQALAAPGHTGRKRGEAVTSVGVLEHRGSGVVVDMTIGTGNGDGRTMLRGAVESMIQTLDNIDAHRPDAALVTDGEFGSVPHLAECAQREVRFLTRCARYEIIKDPLVLHRLIEGEWFEVDDSGSGPTRYACDIGMVRAHAGRDTRADDGTPYEPVDCRLIASAYRSDLDTTGCGVQVGAFRVELYWALGMEPAAFGPNDLVTLFYSRCGQEVAFAHHKSKLGLQRIFCNNLGGQLMAMVGGAFVWNLRIAAGVALCDELPTAKEAAPRCVSPVGDAAIASIRNALRAARVVAVESDEVIAPVVDRPSDEVIAPVVDRPSDERTAASPADGEPEGTSEEATCPASPSGLALRAVIGAYDWSTVLRGRPGWSFDRTTWEVITATGVRLSYKERERTKKKWKLRFFGLDASGRRQGASFVVPNVPGSPDAQPKPQKKDGEAPPRRGLVLVAPAIDGPAPRLEIGWPCFVVAAAVRVLANLVRGVEFHVSVQPRRTQAAHPLVAATRRERQHQRLTWSERNARRAQAGRVRCRIAGAPSRLRPWVEAKRAAT